MHALLEKLVSVAARMPRRLVADTDVKLNLGSSTVVAPGWLNLDLSPNAAIAQLPRTLLAAAYSFSGSRMAMTRGEYINQLKSSRYIFCDLTNGIPVRSETAAVVYSSHFIEHLTPRDARELMRETYRVVKPGGVVRFTCPDVGYFAREYANGTDKGLMRILLGDHGYHGGPRDVHRSFWDLPTIQDSLEQVGFTDITEQQHRVGVVPDLELLETHSSAGSLYVEARKPVR